MIQTLKNPMRHALPKGPVFPSLCSLSQLPRGQEDLAAGSLRKLALASSSLGPFILESFP